MRELARARPLLGTFVEVRAAGMPSADALAAIERAFLEIGEVHRYMSFHQADSDLSRLHRAANGKAITVNFRTHEVLARALHFAQASNGCFDPCVAAELVELGCLPPPHAARETEIGATWRDIDLSDRRRVRLRRRLWIDLGGIAKGYAVDRAIDILRDAGAASACVNAGGDLRRFGATAEAVELRLTPNTDIRVPALEVADGAVATSIATPARRQSAGRLAAAHVHGRTRRSLRAGRSVSVVAADCCTADALTKILLVDLRIGKRLLRTHSASACVYDERRGWSMLHRS